MRGSGKHSHLEHAGGEWRAFRWWWDAPPKVERKDAGGEGARRWPVSLAPWRRGAVVWMLVWRVLFVQAAVAPTSEVRILETITNQEVGRP